MQPGKECGFETDVNVPLIVRGPGIAKGKVTEIVTTHTDLAPTFLSLIGGTIRSDFDGSAIPVHASALESYSLQDAKSEHVNIEFWGFALTEGEYDQGVFWNHTYKALRLIGKDYNLYYSVWCSGEHELYDLKVRCSLDPLSASLTVLQEDPYQLSNLYPTNHSATFSFSATSSTNLFHLLPRLDSLILVLKTCKTRSCTHPWEVLHPEGDVKTLHDALHKKFDHFYETEQERVSFTKCEKGYILESEGAIGAKSFSINEVGARGGRMWSELV